MSHPRIGRAASVGALLALVLLQACAIVAWPLKTSNRVAQQAERSVAIRIGESTRAEVEAALGEPWLRRASWGVDVYRADDERDALGLLMVIYVLPVPVGVYSVPEQGYVLIAYDQLGRVAGVDAGSALHSWMDQSMVVSGQLLLGAGGVYLGIQTDDGRDPQLFADPAHLAAYLEGRRGSPTCTLLLACDISAPGQRWPEEGCPDRVAIDGGEPLDLGPFVGHCGEGRSCPPMAQPYGGSVRIPLFQVVTLAPGSHRLSMASSRFDGHGEAPLDCAAGEIRSGLMRGRLDRNWWDKRHSTIHPVVAFSEGPPENLASYGLLLYRRDRWLVEPEPAQPLGAPVQGPSAAPAWAAPDAR
jgi:hypothetical protein